MPKESSESDLFELKNFFVLGKYQAAINEGSSLGSSLEEGDRIERDVYIYRSYIGQGKYRLVTDEIKDSRAPTSLQAVKLLATYLSSEDKEIALATLKEWLGDGVAANNPILQLVAATIYTQEEKYEEAMRCVYQANSLEGLAMLVQLYLRINRVDLADKELKGMQKIDEDATITQLTQVWVLIAQGGEGLNEALATLRDLTNKFGASGTLFNLMGVCSLHLKQFSEAEKYFQQALEKNPSDVDTMINLIACHQHQGKTETVGREINQLRAIAPKHPWLRQLTKVEDDFEKIAKQFAL